MQGSAWQQLRARALRELEPVCCFCHHPIDVELPGRDPWGPTVHHVEQRQFGGAVIVPVDQLQLAHNTCHGRHGASTRARAAGYGRGRPRGGPGQLELGAVFSEGLPEAAYPSDSLSPSRSPRIGAWDETKVREYVQGADDLAESITPPRLETPPQDDVTGTYGDLAEAWLDHWLDIQLWPWQRYVLRRALEHRADGSLRWRTVLVSTSRQSGKSVLARAIMSWRLFAGTEELFGEPQTLMHVASNRQIGRTVWKAAARTFEEKVPEAVVRYANGQEAIELPDGSSWEVLAANMHVVGRSVSMAFVDEAFDVDQEVVEQGIAPTMLQRESPQLWLVSTAGDSTSDLMRSYRERAISQLEDSTTANVLILEWSASPELDALDPEAWRQASPQWDTRRAELVAERARLSDSVAFELMYLNRWISGSARAWLTEQAWGDCQSGRELPAPQVSPGTVAVERSTDDGRALSPYGIVLAVKDTDGQVVVRSWIEQTEAAAWARLEQLALERRGLVVMHHETVRIPSIRGAVMRPVRGYTDQYQGYAATRGAIMDGTLHHDGSAPLTEQVITANTFTNPDGRVMLSTRASEGPIYAARAMVWACSDVLRVDRPGRPLIASARA
jgi:hypothetical protein